MEIIGILIVAALAALSAVVATSPLWGFAFLEALAKKNLFFTEVKEGTAKAITRFGKFDRCVMAYEGYQFDEKWNVEPDNQINSRRDKSIIDKIIPRDLGGLHWIGWPSISVVHTYSFQWTSLRQGGYPAGAQSKDAQVVKEDDLVDLFVSRDEKPDYINLMDDVYVFRIEKAENKEMIPLNFRVLLTIRVTNPYLALFHTEQWLEMVVNTLRPIIKQYVGEKTFEELAHRNENLEHEADEILNRLTRGEKTGPSSMVIKDYIKDRWGVQVKKIGIVNVNTGGKAGEAFEEAAAKKYTADREAERIGTLALAEKRKIELLAIAESRRTQILAIGEAKRIKTVAEEIKNQGNDALTLRTIEAIETAGKNGNTILVGGNQPVQMLLNAAKKGKEASL